jgi:hypothetical protein
MKTFSNHIRIVFMFVISVSLARVAYGQNNCVLKKDKDNIRVYSCESKSSAYNKIQAEFELDATIEEYLTIVQDVDSYKAWHYHVINARLLEWVSDSEMIYYTQVSAPWPVSNRDVIIHLKLNHNKSTNSLTVNMKSLNNYMPITKGFVRVAQSNAALTLTPIANSRLKVNYSIQVDPGGKLPPWVVDLVSSQGPYETFKNLKERISLLRKNSVSASLNIK